MFHQEVNWTTRFSATEARVDVLTRRHLEAPDVPILMEGAEAFILRARLPQGVELAHHIHDTRCILDASNCKVINHI
jgi:hypothetical protein